MTSVLQAAYNDLAVTNSKLRAEVERLRAALEPFAAEAERYDPQEGDDALKPWAVADYTVGDLRRARDAINHQP